MMPTTPAVRILLIINIILFIASQFIFPTLINYFALYYPVSSNFEPYQLITHLFMHGGFFHILFNMFSLLMFGSTLESVWGAKRFLIYYFFCGVGAVALHLGIDYYEFWKMQQAVDAFRASPTYENFGVFFSKYAPMQTLNEEVRGMVKDLGVAINGTASATSESAASIMQQYIDESIQQKPPMVGASGAIWGLFLAFAIMYPNIELMVFPLPIPIKAKYMILIMICLEVILGFGEFAGDNVAHFAHLGGGLFGMILLAYWGYFRKK